MSALQDKKQSWHSEEGKAPDSVIRSCAKVRRMHRQALTAPSISMMDGAHEQCTVGEQGSRRSPMAHSCPQWECTASTSLRIPYWCPLGKLPLCPPSRNLPNLAAHILNIDPSHLVLTNQRTAQHQGCSPQQNHTETCSPLQQTTFT